MAASPAVASSSSASSSSAAAAAAPSHQRHGSGITAAETKAIAAKFEERYIAHMILTGVGDAMGYNGGSWEFARNGQAIHDDMLKITKGAGPGALVLQLPKWNLSDDTIMSIASARGLLASATDDAKLLDAIAREYVLCFDDMGGRAPGITTANSIRIMGKDGSKWKHVPWARSGGGCGGCMRSMVFGLAFPHPSQLKSLLKFTIESARMTHHHPTGFLGSVAGGLFTALALQGVPAVEWAKRLLDVIPLCKEYIAADGRDAEQNLASFDYFTNCWTAYAQLRGIVDGKGPVKFPTPYGVAERDAFYKSVSFDGWGGASGHDAPLIAYDALLGADGNWTELCLRGVLHGGDSDSTGTMACAWYGTQYGFKDVPDCNHTMLEYRSQLVDLAKALYARYGAVLLPAAPTASVSAAPVAPAVPAAHVQAAT